MLHALLDVRYLPDLILLGIVLTIQMGGAVLMLWGPLALQSRIARALAAAGAMVSCAILILGFLLRFARVNLSVVVVRLGARTDPGLGFPFGLTDRRHHHFALVAAGAIGT